MKVAEMMLRLLRSKHVASLSLSLFFLSAFSKASKPTSGCATTSGEHSSTFSQPRGGGGEPARDFARDDGDDDDDALFDQPMSYSIFRGRSCLPSLLIEVRNDVLLRNPRSRFITKTARALALTRLGWYDAAHEVLLGVDLDNVAEAEHAATHRGQTDWAEQHPLDATDDLLHSILHRVEGARIGEGGRAGHRNAEYWAAGGPRKESDLPTASHPAHRALRALALARHPEIARERALVVPDDRSARHEIIAGTGDGMRTVCASPGDWDAIAVIRSWEATSTTSETERRSLRRELARLHRLELELLTLFEESGRALTEDDLVRAMTAESGNNDGNDDANLSYSSQR